MRASPKHGLLKATIVDIAKMANVSRSTIYEYFSDKGAILEACAEHASEHFYREMSKAMERGGSLEEKLAQGSGVREPGAEERAIASEEYFDEDAISLLLTKDAGVLLRECVDFFAPHLSARPSSPARFARTSTPGGRWSFRAHPFLAVQHSVVDAGLGDPDVVARVRHRARGAWFCQRSPAAATRCRREVRRIPRQIEGPRNPLCHCSFNGHNIGILVGCPS